MDEVLIHVLGEVQEEGGLLLVVCWGVVRGEGVHPVAQVIVLHSPGQKVTLSLTRHVRE